MIEPAMRRRISLAILLGLFCASWADGAVLYGLKSSIGDGGSAAPTLLFQANVDGSALVSLGTVTLNGSDIEVDGLAASTVYGLLGFQQTTAGSRLLAIDAVTAVATPVQTSGFNFSIRGADFLENDELWGVDLENRALIQFSPGTGAELDRVELMLQGLPFTPNASTDLAHAAGGQVLLVSDRDIYSVNMNTGDLTLLFHDSQIEPAPGSLTPPTLVGAAVVGNAGSEQLLALDSAGAFTDDLYSYDLQAAFARTVAAANVLPQLDAGLGDLAVLQQTVVPGDYNQDVFVDAADYTVWRDTLGSTSDLRANGDNSGPSMGLIDTADYVVWKNNFGTPGAAALSAASVPEPDAAMILLLGLSSTYPMRRRA